VLQTGTRDYETDNDDHDNHPHQQNNDIKPEAQFTPYLFLQERKPRVAGGGGGSGGGGEGRSMDKTKQAVDIQRLAQQLAIPVAYVDKGALNTLSGNRPHQGCVLRCGRLQWESLPENSFPRLDRDERAPCLWIVLDQIVDPQNLGALLRSAYFFGPVGVLVCAKNSAPLSPAVSSASAGALEEMVVYATNNLPRTLGKAAADGCRIIGAAAAPPAELAHQGVSVYDLMDAPPLLADVAQPTLLVLGSEGHGLRPLVAQQCTDFVKIPSGSSDADQDHGGAVDSLNVSVTGGILLWHLMHPFLKQR
jgi:21S rRNA (GM2251-2'-O)-methyltransferase